MAGGRPKTALCSEFAAPRAVGTVGQFALSSGRVCESSQDSLARKDVPKSLDVYFTAGNYGTQLTSKSNAGWQHSRHSTYASLRPMPLAPGGLTGLRNKPFVGGRFAA